MPAAEKFRNRSAKRLCFSLLETSMELRRTSNIELPGSRARPSILNESRSKVVRAPPPATATDNKHE